ncbi:MAG: hypothetical protein A3B70_07635 [Deltaproteobacteria bacterium RIFCSPHIGHO2_02_FULL_40_11]|nr:MAG: hypothetical protein A3B70_07635 [Deltaproteobacteria bacterium RIFCSPHIGHO2_02_FULL_40_11]
MQQGLKTRLLDDTLTYDGTQLAPLWIYKNYDIQGDAMVSFIGPSDLSLRNMVDVEDIKAKRAIFSQKMVHFIGEFFDLDLEKTVYRQRILMVLMKEVLEAQLNRLLTRSGDDLYDGDAKITVSIATLSNVSTLIHAGVNISSEGTPVKTKALNDYNIEPRPFAHEVLDRFREELESCWLARCKVRSV